MGMMLVGKRKQRADRDGDHLERCVVCRCVTDIPKEMPVSERYGYVEGVGQLCRRCCIEIYGTDRKHG